MNHPIKFDWLAIEKISEAQSHLSLDATANQFNTLLTSLKFARTVLFHGIEGGYREQGTECPFKSSEDVAKEVKKFSDVAPVLEQYTKAVQEFYAPVEESDDKKKAQNP
jgi:hypothetical protein